MSLLADARMAAGMSQSELARRAHTSQPTLSAYENGRTSPTLDTAARLLAETGHHLTIDADVTFAQLLTKRGRPFWVPSHLPRLPLRQALATVTLPLHLNWSTPGARFDLRDRPERLLCYEIVLREGKPADILTYVDGALLVDLWPEMVLPRDIRDAWDQVVEVVQERA
ncbi:helix-turn-helix domain-containing protein [Kutzneria chonburiensis]|uniref:Helix-turn-helix domain-containing protein n=1 Tax=Kutzneria chonburiensis TaxID=1483604 RepID=A0ABV6N2E4_9PSEU|nr:helix-turn-helix transcriptional regulator [Kutzneria chonburiensis]